MIFFKECQTNDCCIGPKGSETLLTSGFISDHFCYRIKVVKTQFLIFEEHRFALIIRAKLINLHKIGKLLFFSDLFYFKSNVQIYILLFVVVLLLWFIMSLALHCCTFS